MNNTDARALLARQLQAHLENPSYPISYPQQRPWFLDQLHKSNAVYNLPLGYRVKGPLLLAPLRVAMEELLRRHEVLRSVFRTVDGVPRQVVLPPGEFAIDEIDLGQGADAERQAHRLAQEEALTPFDLARGPMVRVKVVRLAARDSLLLISLHHIACDAWSVGIIAREVSALYRAALAGRPHDLPAPRLQYVDFSEWQQRLMRTPERQQLITYWRHRLAGIPANMNLPTDRPRPPVQDYRGAHVAFEIPGALLPALDELARDAAATPYSVLLSAFAVMLGRHAGDEQPVIGTPVANRHAPGVEGLIGFFTNTLVLRPDLSGAPSFRTLVQRVGAETRDALAHQDLPFEVLVEELRPDRDTAHSPVFQVMFIYWDADDGASWDLPNCEFSELPGDSRTSKFDLTLSLTRTSGGIRARLEYATALFDESTAQRLGSRYLRLLEDALACPERPIADLELLPQAESQLLRTWSLGEASSPLRLPVHEAISAQARRTPDQPGVVDGATTMTYAELEQQASALARRLRQAGVRNGSIVGVYLDRSVHSVTALLGVLKAGAAYLPLDPAYPSERLAFMCADARASAVVSRRSLAASAARLGARVVCVDDQDDGIAPDEGAVTLDELAYVIYTSGSTGKPKGVMLTHGNVDTFFAAMDASFRGDAPGTWLAVTSISFDISVLELLWTLTRGFKVVVRAEETAAAVAAPAARAVDFSLFYFGNAPTAGADGNQYRLVMQGARFADAHGFKAVWTPERHFHRFGGLFPNPSVLAAAIAASTERIAIRAGSVVLPLHDPLRVAEEWSVVDNLSGGRVGVSFASGWQPDDFVLAPQRYAGRKQEMLRMIEEVRTLWQGGTLPRVNGAGQETQVGVFPRPVQPELPVWVTSARHPDTFRMAGEAGAHLLTHLVGHSIEQLAEKIALYRRAWRESGRPGEGHVTLMVHTFVHPDPEFVRSAVRQPLTEYIRSSYDLMAGLGTAMNVDLRALPAPELEALLANAFERFFETSGLLGTPEQVVQRIQRLAAIGVDEVGCLIDFGVAEDVTLDALPHLAKARELLLAHAAPTPQPQEQEPLASELARHGVTHLQCTPTLARMLAADSSAAQALRDLRRLLVGGEALAPELADALSTAVGGSVHNMYGPTEATVWATAAPVAAGKPVTIGRPLPGYEAYVVDASMRQAPIGVPGELLLGGPAVARGYFERPELTAERFVPHAFGGHGRLYRTGDLVRWKSGGQLEFLGRLDFQVKLRGRRIELGEIEAALAAHAAIEAAVAEVRGQGDGRAIVAYCIPKAGGQGLPPSDVLRAFLARTLPDHMLPAAFVALVSFPLTPNGKINRRALPDPEHARPNLSTLYEAPEGELEVAVAAAWSAVLRLPQVGVRDNFFEIGGNSILAVAVRSRLQASVDPDLALLDMFRYPTVRALAASIARRRSVTPAEAPEAFQDSGEAAQRRRLALSARQQRRDQQVRG